jgi:hypothetical protein
MSIQNATCFGQGEKLAIRWAVVGFDKVKAISICIARNTEFTDTMRHFVVPVISSVSLDTGPGLWFIRLGTWTGTASYGTIEWTATYGPILISSEKPVVPTMPMTLPIIHKQAILHGMRFFTGITLPYYVLFETSSQLNFPASATKYSYALDPSKGQADCLGMRYETTYSVRISTWSDMSRLPTDSVQQVCEGKIVHGVRCARPLRQVDMTAVKSDNTILRDAKEKPHVRFHSHGDYLRFMAAKAKAGEEITRL